MGVLASANLAGASASAPLPGFLDSLAGPLDHYGYGAIALLLLLENIGVPVVPGELSLIAGAIFAGTGRAGLNVVLVGVVAVIAVIAGAEIGYLIGRFAGRELILHYGKYVFIKPHHLDRAEAIVSRYGGIVVIIARFIVGLREANGIIAGITQMRWFTFLIYNTIGACLWVGTWVTIGYVAGDHISTIYSDINRFSLYILIALIVLLVAYIGWRLVRRRRAAHPPEASKAQGSSVIEETSGTQESSGEAPATAEVSEALEIEEVSRAGEGIRPRETSGSGEAGRGDLPGGGEHSGAQEESGAQEKPETRETQPKRS